MGKQQKIFYSEAEKKQALAGGNRGKPTPKAFKSTPKQGAHVNIIKPGVPNTRQARAKVTDKVIIIKPGTPAATALLARKQQQQQQQTSAKTTVNRPPLLDHQGQVPVMLSAPQQAPSLSSSRQQQPRQQPAYKPTQTALQTAAAIAGNRSHPNHAEVLSLIQTFEKGWIDEARFTELLQGMLF